MSDNTVRRSEAEDGGAVYSVTANADTENMIATAAEFHGCKTGGHHSDGYQHLRRRV